MAKTQINSTDILNGTITQANISTSALIAAALLKTTGSSVNVSSAAPPTVGQVLTATDATHAIWQTAPGAAAGGSNTQLQYNNSGALAGSPALTLTGTTIRFGTPFTGLPTSDVHTLIGNGARAFNINLSEDPVYLEIAGDASAQAAIGFSTNGNQKYLMGKTPHGNFALIDRGVGEAVFYVEDGTHHIAVGHMLASDDIFADRELNIYGVTEMRGTGATQAVSANQMGTMYFDNGNGTRPLHFLVSENQSVYRAMALILRTTTPGFEAPVTAAGQVPYMYADSVMTGADSLTLDTSDFTLVVGNDSGNNNRGRIRVGDGGQAYGAGFGSTGFVFAEIACAAEGYLGWSFAGTTQQFHIGASSAHNFIMYDDFIGGGLGMWMKHEGGTLHTTFGNPATGEASIFTPTTLAVYGTYTMFEINAVIPVSVSNAGTLAFAGPVGIPGFAVDHWAISENTAAYVPIAAFSNVGAANQIAYLSAETRLQSSANLMYDDTNFTLSAGDVILNTAGFGLRIKEGSNAKMGTSTLVAGTVTVPTTAVTANSRILLTIQDPNGGTPGAVYVSTRIAGTSFDITSTSGADTSIVAWVLIEPA